ncbi:uncharacterized protein Dwil_GK25412 [Drosophila willistoni]|uniref:Uncharacterized protein n=1 Tax=Drosophila willistoni TaxID=7260 RepID=B4NDS9_DROWI|nr:uncharacterized protein Dwil_GK25412 [Drosophila willistoni]
MYNLNTHDLYGQSNEYCRRSGNFEFQFSGPESIPNAVKRYNKQRAAELAQLRKDREPSRPTMPRFCKVRRSGNDVLSMVTSRDLDVETQLSLEPSALQDDDDDDDHDNVAFVPRVEQHVGRLCGGAEGGTRQTKSKKSKSKSKSKSKKSMIIDKADDACQQIEALHREVCAELEFMEEINPIKPKSQRAAGTSKVKQSSTTTSRRRPKKEVEVSFKPLPKAEDVLERLKMVLGAQRERHEEVICAPDISCAPCDTCTPCVGGGGDRVYPQLNSITFEDYPQQQPKWVDIMPSPMVWTAIQVNVCDVENASPMLADQFMDQHGSAEPEPMTPFFLEDGDLEHEYANRPGYMRYLEPRPTCTSSEQDPVQTSGDQTESGLLAVVKKPCFIELEQRPHRISLLRSLQPMRYTSQRSEETHVPTEEDGESELIDNENVIKKQQPKAKMMEQAKKDKSMESTQTRAQQKRLVGLPPSTLSTSLPAKPQKSNRLRTERLKTGASSPSPSPPKFTSQRQQQSRRQLKSKAKATKTEEHAAELKARHLGGRDAVTASPSIPAPPSPTRMSVSPTAEKTSPRRRRQQQRSPVVCTRSLENLKFEKLTIYNKISMTQEKIISSLDQLQNSLLQLHVPPCSALERQRRERNAFEFCVRFARNFLYPLKGMIDDVRCTPVACFNSAKSNEACQRVVCVYGLVQQSIQTFQRQLRYFLLDKVPQKLSALIEMIYTMTNVCLDKSIMDRQDPVVECLQQRCTKFLTFIEDMQEERFQLARETYRRLRKRGHKMNRPRYHHYHRTQSEVRSQRYDLKMCLNDLKFYEPRLVPRKDTRPKPLLRVRKMKGHSTAGPLAANAATKVQSDTEIPPAIDQLVKTQIENIHCRGDASSTMSFDRPSASCSRKCREKTESQKHKMENKLHEALFEALQHVSKNQVQQVLDPLMRSLGAMLQKQQAQPGKD